MQTHAPSVTKPVTQSVAQSLANPSRFMALSGRVLPWITAAAVAALAYGLWLSLTSPQDYLHKYNVRIMYVHVPAAWTSMGCYLLVALSSFGYLVWRHPLADASAKAAAPVGAAFTLACLVTGAIWGKPGWGAYWVWDARLTSVLVLFLLYLGLMALRASVEDEALAARLTAILAVVGVVLLPIIKFSVDWWWTMHQPASILRLDGPKVEWSLRVPLLVMALAYLLMAIAFHLKATRNEVLRRRLKALRLMRRAPSVATPSQGAQ